MTCVTRATVCLLMTTLALGGLAMVASAQQTEPFVQDRFAIGFWVDPPLIRPLMTKPTSVTPRSPKPTSLSSLEALAPGLPRR